MDFHTATLQYVQKWSEMGYPDDLPDECPQRLAELNLAPSWRAIAVAILKNDVSCQSLGFTPRRSQWYAVLKRAARDAQ